MNFVESRNSREPALGLEPDAFRFEAHVTYRPEKPRLSMVGPIICRSGDTVCEPGVRNMRIYFAVAAKAFATRALLILLYHHEVSSGVRIAVTMTEAET
jgi:hypothetical protein